MKQTSKIWDLIPSDCHAVFIDLTAQMSDLLSEKISTFIVGNQHQYELMSKAGFPSFDQFYCESNQEELLKLLGDTLPFKIPNEQDLNSNNAREWVISIFYFLKRIMEFKPTEEEKQKMEAKFLEDKTLAEFFIRARCMMVDILCLALTETTMMHLIEAAKKGNEEAFLKALRIDQTLIYTDWGQKYYMKAKLSGNQAQIMDITQKINNPVTSINTKKYRFVEQLVMMALWPLGMGKFTYSEMLVFFDDLELYQHLNPAEVTTEKSIGYMVHKLKNKGYLISLTR